MTSGFGGDPKSDYYAYYNRYQKYEIFNYIHILVNVLKIVFNDIGTTLFIKIVVYYTGFIFYLYNSYKL